LVDTKKIRGNLTAVLKLKSQGSYTAVWKNYVLHPNNGLCYSTTIKVKLMCTGCYSRTNHGMKFKGTGCGEGLEINKAKMIQRRTKQHTITIIEKFANQDIGMIKRSFGNTSLKAGLQ
jgi:hypothetical protein